MASDLVRAEWCARIAAEYTSAAVTQQLVLWLMQLGAPPDLLDAGLAIVGDELMHSRLSHATFIDAGGHSGPAIDQAHLGLARTDADLDVDVLRTCVQSFCLGETVAVPLFAHLRASCTVASARAALDRILVDEVRHRDFGWDLLDWLRMTPLAPRIPTLLAAWLPGMFAGLEHSYGVQHPGHLGDQANPNVEHERAWGLAPPHEYAEILARTAERDYLPRFAARDLDMASAWTARRA